jgi:hypothetical protein
MGIVMRLAKCRYEVLCTDTTPFEIRDRELAAIIEEDVAWKRVERTERPGLFQLPIYGPPTDDQPERFRHPVKEIPAIIQTVIREAAVCYVVTAEVNDPPDFGYLDGAIALAGQIALEKKGVVIDRTADIGYTAEEMYSQREVLTVRDTVVIHEDTMEDRVRVWTAGMIKFGQMELLIDDFPAEHVELSRRLLYDNLCHYCVFSRRIGPGQTMQYMNSAPSARLFFSEAPSGLLVVSDCDPDERKPLPGLTHFLAHALPTFMREIEKEIFRQPADAEPAPAFRPLSTIEDFADLMFLMENGKTSTAMMNFGLDHDMLGALTDEWMRKMEDRETAAEYERLMEKRRAKG